VIDSAARASTEENLSQSAARASASDVQTESTARASADPQGHIMTASAFRSSTAHTGGIQLSLDSAADVHLLNADQAHKLLTDIEPAQLQVHGVSAVPALADEKGLLRLDLTSADGRRFNMNLGTAYILKDLPINIISVALMLEQGAVVHLEKGQCYLQPAPDSPRFPLQERGGQFHLDLGTPGEDADVFCSYSGEAHVFIGAADLSTWHHRLAHREKRDIVEWDRQGILPGLKLQGRQDPTGRCIICQMSKARCSPIYSTRAFEEPALAIGHVVHADLKSMRVTSLQGFRYALVFVDMFSRLTILYFLRSKSETSEMLPELIAEFKRYGHTIRTMYTDRGSEFYSGDGETFQDHHRRIADFTRICDSHGGRHRVAPVEHKAQLSEAAIKVTFDAATTQLWHAYLSPVFWPESAAFANYVRNRLPNNHLGGFISPMTAFTGQEQRVDHIRVFGCDCVGVIPNNDLRKVAGLPRGRKLLFMGFDRHREGYLCFDPVTRRFVTQKDLYFCENMQGRHSALIQHDRFREMIKDGVDFEDLPLQLDDRRDPDVRSLDTIRGLYMDPEIPFEAAPQLLEHDDYHVGGVKPTSQPSDEPELAGREDEVPADPNILRRPCRTTKRGIRVTMTDEDRRFIRAAETDNFAIQFVPNPKTPGGASFDRYDLYKSAGTIGEARTLGASRQDIKWDYQHGFILFPTRESTEPGHVFTAAVEPVHSLFEDVIMEDAEQVVEIVDNDDDTRRAYNVMTAGSSLFGEMIAEQPMEPRLPEEFQSGNIAAYSLYSFLSQQVNTLLPPTNRQLRDGTHPLHDKFMKSKEVEMDSWTEMKSYLWRPKTDATSQGRQILHPFWVHAIKTDEHGEFLRAKSRCTANGKEQKPWDSFNPEQISASVAHASTFRLLLSLCAMNDLVVCQADITTAFLQAKLRPDDLVYMYPPPELKRPDWVKNSPVEMILQMVGAVYGLKQSGAEFYRTLTGFLKGNGFKDTTGDPCLLSRRYPNGGVLIVATYVDDLTYGASSQQICDDFLGLLRQRFVIGAGEGKPVHHMLGMKIHQDLHAGTIHISMATSIQKLVESRLTSEQRRKMRSVSTPMVIEGVQPNEGATVTEQQYPFREVLGAVMHCANWVRPDIMVATNMLAKFSGNPGSVHALALDRLLMYCYNTATLGIQFQRPTPALERSLSTALPKIEMYCDASHADTPQRRSRIGFVAMLNGGPISFMATEGKTVDTSTMESELHAAFFAAKECIHLADMLFDLGFTPERQCVKIYEDNSSLITRSNGGIKAVRAIRHVQIRIRFLQEQIQEGRIVFEYIPTQDQIGDAMTKPLPGAQFTKLRDLMLH